MLLGHYQVLDEIGRGGMGIVYRGYDPLIGREVALKTVNLFSIVDPQERDELQQRLHREAQSAGRLSHPNIVTIYQIGYAELEPGRMGAFIAMEYVPGANLESLLKMHRECPPAIAIGYLRQAAAALDYAHSRGVIHRDVKPSNLIVTPEGVVKIADFGVAKVLSQNMTQTGVAVGSPHYMSPEQIRGEPVDGRSDQYALAVVAYELLTGRKPFEAPTLSALWYKITTEAPLPPSVSSPDLSRRITPVLFRALSKEPGERFSTCREFVECLATAVFGSEHPTPYQHAKAVQDPAFSTNGAPQDQSGQPAWRRGKLPGILIGSMAIAAAFAISLFIPARWRPPNPHGSAHRSSPKATAAASVPESPSRIAGIAAPVNAPDLEEAPSKPPSPKGSGPAERPAIHPQPKLSPAATAEQEARGRTATAEAPSPRTAPALAMVSADPVPNPASKADAHQEQIAAADIPLGSKSRIQESRDRQTLAPGSYPNPIQQSAPQPEAVPLNYSLVAPPAAELFIVPDGTRIPLRLMKSVTTRTARVGDPVYFQTVWPVGTEDRTFIPADSFVVGRVTLAQRSGRVAGSAELRIRLESLILPNGVTKNLQATLGEMEDSAKRSPNSREGAVKGNTSRRKDAAIAATAVAAGGIASGRLEGLIIGAAAGLIAILLTRGPDLELPQGAMFQMVLQHPLRFEESEIGGPGPRSP